MRPGALSWDQARAVAGRAQPLPPVTVRPEHGIGAVLAGDLLAPAGLPAADTAAMDGFATCGPGPWRVTGRVLAGQLGPAALHDGEAVEIATGAAVPPGTGTVVRHEDAVRSAGGAVTGPAEPGKNIRAAGSDFRAGQLLIRSGTRLTALMAGLAASAGCDEVRVRPRPRASVVITGGEVRVSGLPSATVTRDALGPALSGLIRALGGEVTGIRYTGDSEGELADALARPDVNLHVVTGGSAAGPADRLHKVLADAGAELLVDGVRCRPGHPQLLARLPGGRAVAGLPGNPFAAVAALLTLLTPLLSAWSGSPRAADVTVPRPAAARYRPDCTILLPACLDPAGGVRLLAPSSPASLLSVAHASHLLAAGDGDKAVLLPLPAGLFS
jgi:molybdopterin molybdotransferase